jgi:hypothetical protein
MHKVIVERPRWGSRMTNIKTGEHYSPALIGVATEQAEDFDGGSARHFGADQHHKNLNENLKPLKRFLERNVGRPWDKVYSELRAGIDTRSAIGLHVMQHLFDYVGGVNDLRNRWYTPFVVDRRTGILRKRTRPNRSYQRPDEMERDYCPDGATAGFWKVGEVWYRVEFRVNDPDELVRNAEGRWVLASDRPGFKRRTIIRQEECDAETVARIHRAYVLTNRKYYERTRQF